MIYNDCHEEEDDDHNDDDDDDDDDCYLYVYPGLSSLPICSSLVILFASSSSFD